MYKYAMQEVRRTQAYIHSKLAADVAALEQEMLAWLQAHPAEQGNKEVVDKLTTFVNDRANYVVAEWQALLPRLITMYVLCLRHPYFVLV